MFFSRMWYLWAVTLLLAVFRRPEMLLALLSERRSPFEAGAPAQDDPYVDRVIPLASVPEELCPWRDVDVKAWKGLGRVPNLSGRTVQAIVRSVLGSVPEPSIKFEDPGEVRFGAHAVDLRPPLCHPNGEKQLLKQVTPALREEASELPSWHWTHRDELAALPKGFRRYLLWGLSMSPWTHVELMLAVHDVLDLTHKPQLMRAVARLALLSRVERCLQWCDVVAEVDDAHRVHVVELVIELGAYGSSPSADCRLAIIEANWPRAKKLLSALSSES